MFGIKQIDSQSSTWMMFNTNRTNHCVTRKVFSTFSDSKFALNQLLVFVNVPLMSIIKLVGFGLVMIRLVSSANKTNLDLLLLSSVFVIFIISLIKSKNNNGPSTEPCSTPCFTILQLEQDL